MKANNQNAAKEYDLKLFISGASPNSVRAINNIQRILETHISGRYNLQIVDVYQETSVAQREQIVALPMLVRKNPLPERRLIGDMSNETKVIDGLGLNLEI